MSRVFNYDTTAIIIARYKEDTSWISKFDKIKMIYVYEKENSSNEPYNIPKNKGSEASVYLRYIIDNYNNLPNHLVLLHCHEFSWHHDNSIIDVIESNIGQEIEYKNINNPKICRDLGNYQDWLNGEVGYFYQNLIKPAVGQYNIYDNFTDQQPGCAQFIIHKDRIQNHTLEFYKDIYDWILNIDINFYNHGFYLEWTWELFWNRCLQNTPIRIYENEKILFVFQLDNKFNHIKDITNEVVNELNLTDSFKVTDNVKVIIIKDKKIIKELIANKFIYNKFK
jgi:hypothetical protein